MSEHVTARGNHYRLVDHDGISMSVLIFDQDGDVCNRATAFPCAGGWETALGTFPTLDAVADRYDWNVK